MKIGLTYTGSSEKHLNYVNWIKRNDKLEIIKLSVEENNLDELKKCDGLVLSGGVDIHPRFYGSQNIDYKFKPPKFKEQRDQFEIDVFKLSQEIKIPVLGICRGLQLINCVLGGDLKQDLSELNKTHKGDPDKSHPIKVEANSLLEDIVNVENGKVNSAHHQAINQLGQGLKINARADDGTIEGIERNENGHPFLLAVQWHPERMEGKEKSVLSKNIRDCFIKEIK